MACAIFISLISHHQVHGLADTPLCRTKQATESLLECKSNFLQMAGDNYTEDCEAGIVKTFMSCISTTEGCINTTKFAERTFHDFYGCIDKKLSDREKRRVSCSCYYSCIRSKWSYVSYDVMYPLNHSQVFKYTTMHALSLTDLHNSITQMLTINNTLICIFWYSDCYYRGCPVQCFRVCRCYPTWARKRDVDEEQVESENLCSNCICSIGKVIINTNSSQ